MLRCQWCWWSRIIPAPAGNTGQALAQIDWNSDHPRACGEHARELRANRLARGSSPRLRGTRRSGARSRRPRRIIPAPAGNTASYAARSTLLADHPRACGEHPGAVASAIRSTGSSPRLRGTREEGEIVDVPGRIIPAPAGNTAADCRVGGWYPDHPRACGEHGLGPLTNHPPFGSSPRLRGTRSTPIARCSTPGIIPAPAGNTRRRCARCSFPPDHPRACGEHWTLVPNFNLISGSSPRPRGTRRHRADLRLGTRIIPAPAGNTHAISRRASPTADHPRACGEHRILGAFEVVGNGSSPRLRGTLPLTEAIAVFRRIIPAPAGNTMRRGYGARGQPDHPRACGEHFSLDGIDQDGTGSSPRLRGTLRLRDARFIPRRIIPAPAGNTSPT